MGEGGQAAMEDSRKDQAAEALVGRRGGDSRERGGRSAWGSTLAEICKTALPSLLPFLTRTGLKAECEGRAGGEREEGPSHPVGVAETSLGKPAGSTMPLYREFPGPRRPPGVGARERSVLTPP